MIYFALLASRVGGNRMDILVLIDGMIALVASLTAG